MSDTPLVEDQQTPPHHRPRIVQINTVVIKDVLYIVALDEFGFIYGKGFATRPEQKDEWSFTEAPKGCFGDSITDYKNTTGHKPPL